MPYPVKGECRNTGRTRFKKGNKPKHIKKGVCLNTGRTHFKKGHIPWCAGKERPEVSGKNHYRWLGGMPKDEHDRKSVKYKRWRDSIYKRDNCICRMCLIKCVKEMMIAHHIKSFLDFPELRFDRDNGITLCRSCHVKLHNIFDNKKTRIRL